MRKTLKLDGTTMQKIVKDFFPDDLDINSLLIEQRVREIKHEDVKAVFDEVLRIGGKDGYWSPWWMWKTRATVDKIIGGPGLANGRGSKEIAPEVGDTIDFWKVVEKKEHKDLKIFTLEGELKNPGRSGLQFILYKDTNQKWKLILSAYLQPYYFIGKLYWALLYFPHKYIFTKMINTIVENSKK